MAPAAYVRTIFFRFLFLPFFPVLLIFSHPSVSFSSFLLPSSSSSSPSSSLLSCQSSLPHWIILIDRSHGSGYFLSVYRVTVGRPMPARLPRLLSCMPACLLEDTNTPLGQWPGRPTRETSSPCRLRGFSAGLCSLLHVLICVAAVADHCLCCYDCRVLLDRSTAGSSRI